MFNSGLINFASLIKIDNLETMETARWDNYKRHGQQGQYD